MSRLPLTRIVLYKHGVGHFEREGQIQGDDNLNLTFKQSEVSDVLKSLTVLDLDGGHVASVSYDSTKPLEQLLAEVALSIPDHNSLTSLLPQIKGARIAITTGEQLQGILLGIDQRETSSANGIVHTMLISLLTDDGAVRSFEMRDLTALEILDEGLKRDLEYYLRTQLSAKKKDARTFTFFAQGQGERTVRMSYTIEAPVWKATYRIILPDTEEDSPMIQGWAVVDNTQDEDWENVSLSLVAGLPVSFIHDLYTPRYIRRPEVAVQETTGVLPPTVEDAMSLAAPVAAEAMMMDMDDDMEEMKTLGGVGKMRKASARGRPARAMTQDMAASTPAQVRERKVGDLFEYEIEHPVTISRNQSALVPIVLRSFDGRAVLLYNKGNREDNPMRCVELKNTTGLTLEGGPLTVLEGASYVGEAMLDTLKPDEERLVPYAVELSVHVLDNIDSHEESVHRVVIRRGEMIAHYVQIQKTTYMFNNKSDEEQIVHLEHPRQGSTWELFDTPEPHEVTKNYWRFRFRIAAKQTTQFVTLQKRPLHRSHHLHQMDKKNLGFWIEQKYLDAETAATLKQLLNVQQNLGRVQEEEARLNRETERIHKEQQRIQGNLQSLGDRPSETELRDRLARTLNSQEDRLEAIGKELEEKATEIAALQEDVNKQLGGLTYEARL